MSAHLHWLSGLLLVIPLSAITSITLLVRDEIRSRKHDRYDRYPTTATKLSSDTGAE